MQARVLSFLAAACLWGFAIDCLSQELFWGQDAEGFQLAVSFEKIDLQKGEPVDATVIVKNTSDTGRHLASGIPVHENYNFLITRDRDQAVAPIPKNPSMGKSFNEQLSPNASITNKVRISSLFDLTTPGTYIVTATRGVAPAAESVARYPLFHAQIQIRSGNAIIHVLEGASGVAPGGSASSTPPHATQITVRESATNTTGTTGNPNFPSLQNNSAPAGSSSNVVQSPNGTESPPLATATAATDTKSFSPSQKIGAGILAAFLALLAFILLRGKARQKRSSS